MDFCLRLCQSLLLKPAEENHSLTYVRPAGQLLINILISALFSLFNCWKWYLWDYIPMSLLEILVLLLGTMTEKSTAASLLHGLTNFDFKVVFLITYFFLSLLSGITIKLQSSTMDIVDAYQQIDEIKIFYSEMRKNIDEHFHKIYEQSERMATAAFSA